MFICSNDWLSKTLLQISILVWSFLLYLNKQFAPRGGDMGMQGKMLQPFAMQTLVPNAALGIKFSRGTVFFSASFSVSLDRLQVTRGYKSHSWVFCWIMVVFILLVIVRVSRNNQSFTSCSADNFCENLILAVESYPQSKLRKPRLFCLNAIVRAIDGTNLFWMKSR